MSFKTRSLRPRLRWRPYPGTMLHVGLAAGLIALWVVGRISWSSLDVNTDSNRSSPPALIGVHEALGHAGGGNIGVVPKAPSR